MLRKSAAAVATVALAAVALMFSAVLLTLLLGVVAVMFTYVWWKVRRLRRQMREEMGNVPPRGAAVERDIFVRETFKGEVIEGQAVRVNEVRKTSGSELRIS